MDVGKLLGGAWQMTWRHRFLWVLGMFVGGGFAGSGTGYQAGGNAPAAGRAPAPEEFGRQVTSWTLANIGVIAGVLGLVLLLLVVAIVVSLVATGGMVTATIALGRGEPMRAGQAWRAGLARFWRYFGLGLLQFAIVLALLVVGGAIAGLFIWLGASASGAGQVPVILTGVAVGLLAVLLLVPAAIVFSVVIAFAERAIVGEDLGPVGALASGWRLARGHVASAAMVWLVGLGVGVGGGLVGAIVIGLGALVLVACGFALYLVASFTAIFWVYVALAVVVGIGAIFLVGGIVRTFAWSYWTLAYLQLKALPAPVAKATGATPHLPAATPA